MIFETRSIVAFVDDDEDLRRASIQSLQLAGIEPLAFDSAQAALSVIEPSFPGVLVTDIRMPQLDGHELFRRVREIDADLPVIFITGHGDIDEAVQALHDGAYDFVAKPFPPERLISSVRRALEKRRLVLDNRRLRDLAARTDDIGLIGDSPAMQRLRATIRDIGEAEVDVLIEGETGAGKELIARALHQSSRRAGRPLAVINCAALPPELLEAELFGHEAGAFPGAMRRRQGRIEAADRSTLFLDEVESLSLPAQGKLLRVLEEREFTPLGSNEVRGVNLRVLAAVKDDLSAAVAAGTFRADLFYRLNVVRMRVPPLRERREDIPLLFSHFLEEACRRHRRPRPEVSDEVRSRLIEHSWPGNVRELMHYAERVALGVRDAPAPAPSSLGLAARVDAFEAGVLRDALAEARGDIRSVLERLQLPRKTLYDKLKRHGIEPASYRGSA
jgi:two-component system C4-dicarboxylate transport response regulator DctD